jgi:hypothetical protein
LGNELFITLLRKVGFADRPILGGDCFPRGIRRIISTLLRKVGFADRITSSFVPHIGFQKALLSSLFAVH